MRQLHHESRNKFCSINLGMRRLPTRSLPFQSRLHAFANGPDEAFRSLLRSSRECPILALSNSALKSHWLALDGMGFLDCRDTVFLLSGERIDPIMSPNMAYTNGGRSSGVSDRDG